MQLSTVPRRMIGALENPKVGFGNHVLSFVFIMTVRNFLEMFSDNEDISLGLFAHYYLSYVCLAMGLILLFHLASMVVLIVYLAQFAKM